MAHGANLSSTTVYRDSKGKPAYSTVSHPANTDIGALKAALPTTAELIDAITQCSIERGYIEIPVDLSTATIKAVPLADSDVHEGAKFTFSTLQGNKTSFRIPGFDEARTFGLSGNVDMTQPDMIALRDEIINDTNSDEWGFEITTFEAAIESFTQSRG